MSNRNFWNEFWKNRCVTLDDTEPEVETAAAATEPPVGAAQETEEDYDEYSAKLDSVIEASEAALRDGRECKRRLRQRLRLAQERIRRHSDRDWRTPARDKRTSSRDRKIPTRKAPTRDVDRVPSRSVKSDHTRTVYFKDKEATRVSSGPVESDHTRTVYLKDKEATLSKAHRFLKYVHYWKG